jgi:hypothetical protein
MNILSMVARRFGAEGDLAAFDRGKELQSRQCHI